MYSFADESSPPSCVCVCACEVEVEVGVEVGVEVAKVWVVRGMEKVLPFARKADEDAEFSRPVDISFARVIYSFAVKVEFSECIPQ